MTREEFRRIALAMPDAVEAAHMSHPDFRVGKKVFATIDWPDAGWAMVKLTPAQQNTYINKAPHVFIPVTGEWGRTGSTNIRLATAQLAIVTSALETAWRNVAPKRER